MNRAQRFIRLVEATPAVKKVLDMLDNEEYKNFQNWLDSASTEEVDALFKVGTYPSYNLCPSSWSSQVGTPYPGKLAAALVKTKAAESITDLMNPYYSRGERKNSVEATAIFMTDVMKMPISELLRQLQVAEDGTPIIRQCSFGQWSEGFCQEGKRQF